MRLRTRGGLRKQLTRPLKRNQLFNLEEVTASSLSPTHLPSETTHWHVTWDACLGSGDVSRELFVVPPLPSIVRGFVEVF